MTTVRFKMRDLNGTPIAGTWFRVEPGYPDSVVQGTPPAAVEFVTNGDGQAEVLLVGSKFPYFLTKQHAGAPDQVAQKFFVPDSTQVLEASVLFVDLSTAIKLKNDASLAALINAKVEALNVLNQVRLISSVVLPGSEGFADMVAKLDELTLVVTSGLATANARIDAVDVKATAAQARADQAVRAVDAAAAAAGTAGRLAQHVQADLGVLSADHGQTKALVIAQGTQLTLLAQRLTAAGL